MKKILSENFSVYVYSEGMTVLQTTHTTAMPVTVSLFNNGLFSSLHHVRLFQFGNSDHVQFSGIKPYPIPFPPLGRGTPFRH